MLVGPEEGSLEPCCTSRSTRPVVNTTHVKAMYLLLCTWYETMPLSNPQLLCYSTKHTINKNPRASLQTRSYNRHFNARWCAITSSDIVFFSFLDDAIYALRDEVAENAERDQTSGNGEEPVQVFDVLAWYDTAWVLVAIVGPYRRCKLTNSYPIYR
jgi:hypothetical protein